MRHGGLQASGDRALGTVDEVGLHDQEAPALRRERRDRDAGEAGPEELDVDVGPGIGAGRVLQDRLEAVLLVERDRQVGGLRRELDELGHAVAVRVVDWRRIRTRRDVVHDRALSGEHDRRLTVLVLASRGRRTKHGRGSAVRDRRRDEHAGAEHDDDQPPPPRSSHTRSLPAVDGHVT